MSLQTGSPGMLTYTFVTPPQVRRHFLRAIDTYEKSQLHHHGTHSDPSTGRVSDARSRVARWDGGLKWSTWLPVGMALAGFRAWKLDNGGVLYMAIGEGRCWEARSRRDSLARVSSCPLAPTSEANECAWNARRDAKACCVNGPNKWAG